VKLSIGADAELGYSFSEAGLNVLFTGCTALEEVRIEGISSCGGLNRGGGPSSGGVRHRPVPTAALAAGKPRDRAGAGTGAGGARQGRIAGAGAGAGAGGGAHPRVPGLSHGPAQPGAELPDLAGAPRGAAVGGPPGAPAGAWSSPLGVPASLPQELWALGSLEELRLRGLAGPGVPPGLHGRPARPAVAGPAVHRARGPPAVPRAAAGADGADVGDAAHQGDGGVRLLHSPSLLLMSSLRTLRLKNLWTASDELEALAGSLTHLDLWGAKGHLRAIPEGLGQLRLLRHLDCRGSFRALPGVSGPAFKPLLPALAQRGPGVAP